MRHLENLGILLCLALTTACGAYGVTAEHAESGAYEVVKTEAEWRAALTAEQYHVLREKGTERAFTGEYWDHTGDGVYRCAACGQPLFSSAAKFKSGSGWPSFWEPIGDRVATDHDTALGIERTEILCSRCGGHLGHIFPDGPRPTGLRFCVNSAALAFGAEDAVATFAGGCFWCMEPPFDKLDGVVSTTAGYIGGHQENPTYKQVSSGGTGHAEAIQIIYDPAKVTYAELLDVFWRNIDPTAEDRQFCDRGDQYRSGIFYHDDEQRRLAEESKRRLLAAAQVPAIVTEITAAPTFYPAEDYHQDYYQKNPVRYKMYRAGCGRDRRLAELWGG